MREERGERREERGERRDERGERREERGERREERGERREERGERREERGERRVRACVRCMLLTGDTLVLDDDVVRAPVAVSRQTDVDGARRFIEATLDDVHPHFVEYTVFSNLHIAVLVAHVFWHDDLVVCALEHDVLVRFLCRFFCGDYKKCLYQFNTTAAQHGLTSHGFLNIHIFIGGGACPTLL